MTHTSRTHLNLLTVGIAIAGAFACGEPIQVDQRSSALHGGSSIALVPIGTFSSGVFDDGAAEIVAHDPKLQRVYVVNGSAASIDVLDIRDPRSPTRIATIAVSTNVHPSAAKANSVAVSPQDGTIAAAVEHVDAQQPGFVALFNADGELLSAVRVGALPDMLTFTPDGTRLLVANEGEPSDDYTIDPEGSISIIDTSGAPGDIDQNDVTEVTFSRFNSLRLDRSVRIFGPGSTVAQDLEPEFIAVSDDSRTAWVTLQENNAIATIDIRRARVSSLRGLGFKDHRRWRNRFDASDEDGQISHRRWPVRGMYQPDAIASYRKFGHTFLITANEGDARDYDGFSEERRVAELTLDPHRFPNAVELQRPENLGRLKVSSVGSDVDQDGDVDRLFSFGGRSFSIWSSHGWRVFDSGSDFERITARTNPTEFNSDNDANQSFDSRSDDKGPEPEGVVVGRVGQRDYAFIGLERIGGIVVYDVSNPFRPRALQYVNNRDFSGIPSEGTAGDLGPEGLLFVPRAKSPIDHPLLIVGNEVSGTTTIYRIDNR